MTGDWFTINGGWKLLDDRLGIAITVDNPNNWTAGDGRQIRAIDWFASPSMVPTTDWGGNATNGYPPVFRLTTVIEDDRMLSAIAAKRTASPTQFTRRRRADCRDHFQYNRILSTSMYNSTGKDVIARDDTALAQAHAYALRSKTEFPPVSGAFGLPFVTDYYQLGDRISQINGRNMSLLTNVGTGQGEAPNYPFVVTVSWHLGKDRQGTSVQLSDHRAEGVNL